MSRDSGLPPIIPPAMALILAVAASQPAVADNDELLSEGDLMAGLQTAQSATRLEQQIRDIPASVTVIDQAMIRASGAVNIADLFRLVPGFQAYQVHANAFGVVSHGQGESHPGRLEVMIDGRSVYLPLLSTVDWSALGIGLDDISYIEVVRGSNVPTQGSNAFLGAINIITRSALQDQGTRIGTTRGDLNTQEYYLRHSARLGEMDYRLSLNYHKNNGTGIGREDGLSSKPEQSMEDGGEISQLSFRGTWTPTLVDSFDVQLGVSGGQFGVGNAADPAELSTRDVDTSYQQLIWSRQLNDSDELKVQAYHNYHRWKNLDQRLISEELGISPSQVPLEIPGQSDELLDFGQQDGTTERLDIELEHALSLGEGKRLVWGSGIRWEQLTSAKLIGAGKDVDELIFRLFGNYEWKPSARWTFNAGAMLEQNDLVGAQLSPRIGANWHINDYVTLRSSISQSYRTPSLLEENQLTTLTAPISGKVLDLITVTTGDLDPERVRTYELGLISSLPEWGSTFDLKFYLEEVDDAIGDVKVKSGDPFTNTNEDNWKTKGFDLQWKLQPWRDTWFNLAYGYADAQGSYIRFPSKIDEPPFSRDNRAPRHTLSALVSHNFTTSLQGSLIFYRQTATNWLRGSPLDSYNRLDARLAKDFQLGRNEGSVELIVQNLLSPYTEFEVNNTFDTRTFVRVSLNFL